MGRALTRDRQELQERTATRGARGIRFYSSLHREPWLARGLVTDAACFTIGEGVDFEKIGSELGEAPSTLADLWPTHTDVPIFGFLGRKDVFQKGLDKLLDAWQIYKTSGGRGRLRIAGPSSTRSHHFSDLTAGKPLKGVEIGGPLAGRAKYEFLAGLTALIHTSRHESAPPRVLREALAVGCPVVVTPETNIVDTISEFGAGWCTEGDPPAIARTLHSVSAESNREKLGSGALRAAESLNPARVAKVWVDELTVRLAGADRSAPTVVAF